MADLKVFYNDNLPLSEYKLKTLCYLRRRNESGEYEFLLGKHYKQQKWNGFGGKVGDKPEFKNESIEEALIREGKEELGIEVVNPEKRAIILFVFSDEEGIENKVLCHVFFAEQWRGEIKGSDELLTPTWFNVHDFPWEEMWPNDRMWLEELLVRPEFLEAEFKFDQVKGLIAEQNKMNWRTIKTTTII